MKQSCPGITKAASLANETAHAPLSLVVQGLAQPASNNHAYAAANTQDEKDQSGLLH
jgi:hypothetical protein